MKKVILSMALGIVATLFVACGASNNSSNSLTASGQCAGYPSGAVAVSNQSMIQQLYGSSLQIYPPIASNQNAGYGYAFICVPRSTYNAITGNSTGNTGNGGSSGGQCPSGMVQVCDWTTNYQCICEY